MDTDNRINRRVEDARLDRIEENLDKLSEAMISLARVEEKLINMEYNSAQVLSRMDNFQTRVSDVEKEQSLQGHTITVTWRLFYVLAVAFISSIGAKLLSLNIY